MSEQTSEKIMQINHALDDIDSIRVLLYLDKYNPNILLENLSGNLNIEQKKVLNIITTLIQVELVSRSNETYRLSDTGRNLVKNLKSL